MPAGQKLLFLQFRDKGNNVLLTLLSRHTIGSGCDLPAVLRIDAAQILAGLDAGAVDWLASLNHHRIRFMAGRPAGGVIPSCKSRISRTPHQHLVRIKCIPLFPVTDKDVNRRGRVVRHSNGLRDVPNLLQSGISRHLSSY